MKRKDHLRIVTDAKGAAPPEHLSAPEALRIVRDLAADSSRVAAVAHARKQMKARKVSFQDVLRVLQRGAITEGPYTLPDGDWRMNLTSWTGGVELTVVAELEWKTRLLVITVIARRSGRRS